MARTSCATERGVVGLGNVAGSEAAVRDCGREAQLRREAGFSSMFHRPWIHGV